jgi:hypothetical protein
MMFFAVIFVQYTFVSFKNYGQLLGHSDKFLTFVNSIGLIFNALARLLGGIMLDYINFKVFMGTLMGCAMVTSMTIMEYGSSPAVFTVQLCITHYIMGSIFVGMPTFFAQIFGPELGSMTYSYFFTSNCFSTLLLSLVVAFAQPVIGYSGMF